MMEVFIILGLILLNGIFAMSEMALVASRRSRLESEAAKGDKQAKDALKLLDKPDTFFSTVQIGITLIGILNGIFSGKEITNYFKAVFNNIPSLQAYSNALATTVVVIIITYFSLVLGELLPKRIGLSNPEAIAKTMAAPMKIVSYIMYPFVWLLTFSSNFLAKLLRIRKKNNEVTEEEIKAMIHEGAEHGNIEKAEQKIIERVFHLTDRNITSLMTHRSEITWIDMNAKVADVKKLEVHSVYPVCEGSIDEIKGVVALKDLFAAPPETPIKNFMQKALYVPENNSAYQVLEKFKNSKSHCAFIVDEYGTLQGIITLNDILEAIVGEITQLPDENYEIIQRPDGSYLADGQLPFFDFLIKIGAENLIPEQEIDFDTLAGFILYHLERIPNAGDKLVYKNYEFEIIDMDGQRIDKILITPVKETSASSISETK